MSKTIYEVDGIRFEVPNEAVIYANARIAGLKHISERQSEQLAHVLNAKNFKQEELNQRNVTLSKLQRAIDMQGREIVQLKDELRKFKPVDPKFRVGQVVVRLDPVGNNKDRVFRVRSMQYSTESKVWLYSDNPNFKGYYGIREDRLRVLTSEEV